MQLVQLVLFYDKSPCFYENDLSKSPCGVAVKVNAALELCLVLFCGFLSK